jgi:carboxylate-amine ligase
LVTEDLDDVLNRLEPVAKKLHCVDELAAVSDIVRHGASYQRQRRVAEEHDGDLRAVVDALVAELEI